MDIEKESGSALIVKRKQKRLLATVPAVHTIRTVITIGDVLHLGVVSVLTNDIVTSA
jgi:hypothetical protein